MSDTSQDQSGIQRSPTGEIVDQALKTTKDETEKTTDLETEGSEKKTEPDKDADGKSLLNKDQKEAEAAKAPDKYEFKVPEGFELDETVSKEASDLFKSMNLPQAAAQSLVDFYIKQTQAAVDAPLRMVQEQNDRWIDEVKADKDLGPKIAQVRTTISKAIDGLGDPILAKDFRTAMDFTGAGNHPAFIKALYKLAQQVTEGGHVRGNGPSPGGQENPKGAPKDAAHALYPNLS